MILAPSTLVAVQGDLDNDGLRDEVETNTGVFVSATNTGTNPNLADTDGDSLPDGMEVNLGTNPLDAISKVKRPNIIFILVDDLGYGDVGCFWQNQKSGTQKFATPGLDSMAAQGAMLTHHYTAAPLCAPARGSFFQGRHQGHSDIRDLQFDKPLPNNHTIASILSRAGYYTVHIGKNGLAGGLEASAMTGAGSRNIQAHPLARGFNRFLGYYTHFNGSWEHYPQNGTTGEKAFIYDDYQQITGANVDLYTTDIWTAFAKKNIIEETQNHPNRPFFIYLAYDTPHAFLQFPPSKDYPTGKGVSGGMQWTGAPSYVNTSTNDPAKIDNIANRHASVNESWPLYAKKHVSMVRRIDDAVDDLLQTLRDLHIDDNTLVVFTSDNGPHYDGGNNPTYFQSYAKFEGTKRDMWEGGLRVPTIAWWPGKVTGTSQTGNVPTISTPCALWEWFATFADLAKVPVPSIADGDSLVPALTGGSMQRKKDYLYFEHYDYDVTPAWSQFPNHSNSPREQMQALRIGDFMGVRTAITSASDNFKIYNAVTDPAEANNLASSRPDLQTRMQYLALAARRKGADVTRPYDSASIPPVDPGPVINGLDYKSYEGYWPWLPEFRDLVPVTSGVTPNIAAGLRSRDKDVGLSFTGYLAVPTAGAYTFSVTSDGGTSLWIHDGLVIDNDFNFAATRTSDSVFLEAGLHPIRLFYRHQSGTATLALSYSGPNIPLQAVPAASLFAPQLPAVITAVPDRYTIQRNTSVLMDVLANDTANFPLTLRAISPPKAGTAAITSEEINYSPRMNILGVDTVTYQAAASTMVADSSATIAVLYDHEIWLPLDEGAGSEVHPVGEQEQALGTFSGMNDPATNWIDGKFGKGLRFDGIDDQVDFPSLSLPLGSVPRTFTCWVRTSARNPAERPTLFSYGTRSPGQRFSVRLNDSPGIPTDQAIRLEVEGGYITGTRAVNDGAWHHLAFSVADHNGDGVVNINETRMYVDGQPDAAGSSQSAVMNTTSGMVPSLGGSSHSTGYNFTGDLDEIRIFSRALSANEIIAVFQSDLIGSPPKDTDGDGISNAMEAIAGTDPADPRSVFKITGFSAEAGGLVVNWSGHAGRIYQIEESLDLSQWHPAPNTSPIMGIEGPMECHLAVPQDGAKNRFYRVRVELAP